MTRVEESSGWLNTRVTASEAAAAAAPAASICGTAASAAGTSPFMRARAAVASAAPEAGRFSGCFDSSESTSRRTGSETVSGSGGCWRLTCAMAISTCESPVNGRFPASAS